MAPSSIQLGKDKQLDCMQPQMLSQHSRPSLLHKSDSSDPRPSKRAKIETVGNPEAIGSRVKAERWFNETNNNASGTKDVPYLDSESHLHIVMMSDLTH